MSRVEKGYAAYIQRLKEEWQAAEPGEPLNRLLANTVGYLEAASELTRDELALVSEAVRRDLHALAAARGGYRDSAFFNALKESVWSWLLELADRPELEWQSVQDELRHPGSDVKDGDPGQGARVRPPRLAQHSATFYSAAKASFSRRRTGRTMDRTERFQRYDRHFQTVCPRQGTTV